MYQKHSMNYSSFFATLAAGVLLSFAAWAGEQTIEVELSGEQSVPPVETAGSGEGTIVIDEDGNISGSVTTENVEGVAAHIHEAAAGENGPVAVPLEQSADNTWSVPDGAQLSEAQQEALKAGNLYVNVHTAANPNGEIRGQLEP